jgi:hypothetical protein
MKIAERNTLLHLSALKLHALQEETLYISMKISVCTEETILQVKARMNNAEEYYELLSYFRQWNCIYIIFGWSYIRGKI